MNKQCISYAGILVLLSGCVGSMPRHTEESGHSMPRYISPAKYAEYSCDELIAGIAELSRAQVYISGKVSEGKEFSDYVYKWAHKVEVDQNDATIDRYGMIIIYGHLHGACRLAESRNCQNMHSSPCR